LSLQRQRRRTARAPGSKQGKSHSPNRLLQSRVHANGVILRQKRKKTPRKHLHKAWKEQSVERTRILGGKINKRKNKRVVWLGATKYRLLCELSNFREQFFIFSFSFFYSYF
jgi:hypothetical protein